VQSFAVFSPPESANAASPGDLVRGGLHSKSELLKAYDNNTQGIRQLFDHAKISRAGLANAKDQQVHSREKGKDAGWLSWNRTARFGLQQGETSMQVGNQQIYVRPLAAFDVKNTSGNGSYYPAFLGTTTDGKPFAFMKGCANILLKERPTSLAPSASCDSLAQPIITNRINVALSSAAFVKNGAAIKSHVFTLHDSTGKQINQRIVTTSAATAKSAMELSTPGNYTAKVVIMTSAGKKVSTSCEKKFVINKPNTPAPTPKPAASCEALAAKTISRTKFSLTATASTQNGASIKSATFVVKDKSGKEVLTRTVDTSKSTVVSDFEIAQPGNYTSSVNFTTSVGSKTSSDCQAPIVIKEVAPCPVNPNLPINSPECQPCPADDSIWYKDEDCKAKILRTKSAQNISTDKNAEDSAAKAGEKITYTLTVKNEGKAPQEFTIKDDLSDVVEYATVLNNGGGTYEKKTTTLSWPTITLEPGDEQSRMYTVQLPTTVPAAPQGTSDPSSYDCRMTNVFGNTVDVSVDCPAPKVVEQTVSELPTTGPTENMLFAGILFAVVAYFYARSRQLRTEVRLVRRGINTGTI